MNKIAMIVLNYNDSKTTFNYVKLISEYDILDIIIVVDNCSTDKSLEKLKLLQKSKVHVVQTDKNCGYAKGNNFGLRYLDTLNQKIDVVIISNPDIIVEQESIRSIVESIIITKKCFAITGEIYALNNKRVGGFRYKLPTRGMIFVESSVILRKAAWLLFHYGRRYINDEVCKKGNLLEAEALPGCFFAANFSNFKKIGFFDEQTFLYYEEDILFFKARKAGLFSYVLPGVKIIHAEGHSIKKSITAWSKRDRINEDSCIIYLKTCLEAGKCIVALYRIWNKFFLPERYVNMRTRTKYN